MKHITNNGGGSLFEKRIRFINLINQIENHIDIGRISYMGSLYNIIKYSIEQIRARYCTYTLKFSIIIYQIQIYSLGFHPTY